MLGNLKMLMVAAVVCGLAAAATPVRADHVSLGIGIGARPGRVSGYVYPPPPYFSPTFVAPVYGPGAYLGPGYFTTPPAPYIYPPAVPYPYYGVRTPYYAPGYYGSPVPSYGYGYGYYGGRRLHYGRW